MFPTVLHYGVFLAFGLLAVVSPARSGSTVVLPAPAEDRAAQVVTLTHLPAGYENGSVALRTAAGETLPVDENGRVVVPLQHAGERLEFSVMKLTGHESLPAPVAVVQHDDRLDISAEGRPFLSWQLAPTVPDGVDPVYTRSGYAHPVYTLAGRMVTDLFPPNHLHQGGLWMAWTRSNFRGEPTEFWNLVKKKGRIEAGPVLDTWEGSGAAGFEAVRRYVGLLPDGPIDALRETWRMDVFNLPALGIRVFDVAVRQVCATDDPVNVEEYRYGGIAVRGRRDWDGADKAVFLTSDGETDRLKADGARLRWCYMGGDAGGGQAGLAMLAHPENFRAPEPVRVHPKEPYFCFAPMRLGPFAIEPGRPFIARYRIVVVDGPPDPGLLEACWHGFVDTLEIDLSTVDG